MMTPRTHSKLARCWIAATLLMAAIVSPASAQRSWDELTRPNFSQEDFAKAIERLHVTNAQTATLRAMYGDLASTYAVETRGVRAEQDDVTARQKAWQISHPGEDAWGAYGEDFGLTKLLSSWIARRVQLELEFESDVGVALEDAQREEWGRITSSARRVRVLPSVQSRTYNRSGLPDLLSMLDALELDAAEAQTVFEIQSDFAWSLDTLLRDFESRSPALLATMNGNAIGGKLQNAPDADLKRKRLAAASDEWQAMQLAVEAANRTFAAAVADKLGEDNRLKFLDAIDRHDYPELFLSDPVELSVAALKDLATLTPEQRAAVQQIDETYRPARDDIRRRIMAAIKQWNRPANLARLQRRYEEIAAENQEDMGARYEQREALKADHPAIPLLHRRHDLARETCRQLRALFTDEQFAALPLRLRVWLSW